MRTRAFGIRTRHFDKIMATMSGPISFVTGLCTQYVAYAFSEGFKPRSLTVPNEVGLSMADEAGQVEVLPVTVASSPFAHVHPH